MIVLLVSLLGCQSTEAVADAEHHVPNARAIRVEVAQLDEADDSRMEMVLPGEVEGSQDVMLASALGGQVEQVYVEKGEAVRAGQVLARVDGEIYGAQLEQAEAQLAQAQAELARLEKMGDLRTDSQRVQAETSVKIATAQVRAARAQNDRAQIRAPFSGVAADVFSSRGEFLGPGTPVVRLVQLDPVQVTLSVPDRDVVSLRPEMEVTVFTAAVGRPFPGRVAHVGQAADLRTRSFPVDVELPNPDGLLLPGMIATVRLERPLPEGTIAVPQDWIVTKRTGQGVFLESDGFAKWTPITLGDVLHDKVVVTSGLEPGARVVVTGHRDLVDGDAVLVSREGTCCAAGRPQFGG
ncbi:MAG: efflux RND transporter periplasmic adaptor subunit [Myxococcota bacterium]